MPLPFLNWSLQSHCLDEGSFLTRHWADMVVEAFIIAFGCDDLMAFHGFVWALMATLRVDSFRSLLGSLPLKASNEASKGVPMHADRRLLSPPRSPLSLLPTLFLQTFPPLPLRSSSPGLLCLPTSLQADAHPPPHGR